MSKRCGCCASEHEPYTGESSAGMCVEFEVFHADRGALRMVICHDCSTAINAAWARVHGVARAAVEVKACCTCGEPTTANICTACEEQARL
jgi:hypothetical protein